MVKEKVNRSAQIREYLKSAKGDARLPTAVVAALKEKGITVSVGLVSQIKSRMGMKKKRKSKAIRRAAPVAHRIGNNPIANLICAKNLLEAFEGDIKAARSALETVNKLMS